MQPRSWNTPFVIMLIIFGLLVCFHIIYLNTYSKMAIPVSGIVWFYLILWLVLTLGEAILYYTIRKRIKERKLIWVHLIFSLIGFVGMRFVIVLLSYLTYTLTAMGFPKDFLWYAQLIGFWGCLLIGHTALIVALVRIFSAKEPQLPNDDNDFLSEITV